MKKICLFIIGMFLFIPFIGASATTSIEDEKTIATINENQSEDNLLSDGKSAILIEASTGKILYEKNSHERYAPASMTKIMSMILMMEAIEAKKLNWNDTLVASE